MDNSIAPKNKKFLQDLLQTLKELRVNPELFPPNDYPKYELPQFRAWRNDMETIIKHIWGQDSHYLKEYKEIPVYQGFGLGLPRDKKANREILVSAFNHFEGLLLSMLKYFDLIDEPPGVLVGNDRSLLIKIDQCFNDNDIRNLCFALEIDYEHLAGDEKLSKIRELILYCERHALTNKLLKECKKQRPKVF